MKKLSLPLMLGLLLVTTSVAGANLLTNGNLDKTYDQVIVPGPPPFLLPKPLNWVNEGFKTISGPYEDEMSSEPWAGPAPTPVTTDGVNTDDWAAFFKAFTGNATTGDLATGHLYQDVPGTPGQIYILSGWAGAEANYTAQRSIFAIDFLDAGGGVIGTQELDLVAAGLFVNNDEPFDYKNYVLTALAPAGTTTVRSRVSMIGASANPAGGGQAFVVDDFTLEVVPEPSSFVVLATAGLLGIRRLRRS